MDFLHTTRPSPIAGTWYSNDPSRLASEMNAFIEKAHLSDDEFAGEVFGLVAPHAGHVYSGRTAGYAYRTIKGLQRDLVVILSPFHQYHTADVVTTAFDTYVTPLGKVPVETQLLNQLNEVISLHQVQHDPEHAIEIQLPFLQCALEGEFSLLPLMVRTSDPKQLKAIAGQLMKLIKTGSFLMIASTDLSHFHSLDIAQQLDAEMLRRIKAMDGDAVLAAEREGSASACGASSVAMLLYAASRQKGSRTYILNYSTSAEVTGDTSSVVGYGAAAIYI